MGTLQPGPGYALLTTPIEQPHTQSDLLPAFRRQTYHQYNSSLITGAHNFKNITSTNMTYTFMGSIRLTFFFSHESVPRSTKVTLNDLKRAIRTGNSYRGRALGVRSTPSQQSDQRAPEGARAFCGSAWATATCARAPSIATRLCVVLGYTRAGNPLRGCAHTRARACFLRAYWDAQRPSAVMPSVHYSRSHDIPVRSNTGAPHMGACSLWPAPLPCIRARWDWRGLNAG